MMRRILFLLGLFSIFGCGPTGYFRDVDSPPPVVELQEQLKNFEPLPMDDERLILHTSPVSNCLKIDALNIGGKPEKDRAYVELAFDINPRGNAVYYKVKSYGGPEMSLKKAEAARYSIQGTALNRYKPRREIANEEVRRSSRFFYATEEKELCLLAAGCKMESYWPGKKMLTLSCSGFKKSEEFAGVVFPVTLNGFYRSGFKKDFSGASTYYSQRSKVGFQQTKIDVGYANTARLGESESYLAEVLDEGQLSFFVKYGEVSLVESREWNFELEGATNGTLRIYKLADKAEFGVSWAGILNGYLVQINSRYSDHYRTTMQAMVKEESLPFFMSDAGIVASVSLVESLRLSDITDVKDL